MMFVTAQRAGEIDRVTLPGLKALSPWRIGGDPHVIVHDPRHDVLWVTAPRAGTLRAVHPGTGMVSRTVLMQQPDGMALVPGRDTLLVTEGIVADRQGYVAFVDTSTGVVSSRVPVGHAPHSIVVSPDGLTAYVAVQYSGVVAVLDLAQRRVTRTIAASGVPYQLLLAGERLYVSRLFAGHVSAYDTTTGHQVADYTLSQGLSQVALSPDQKRLYVAEKGLAFLSGYPTGNVGRTVAVIDLATGVSFPINVPPGPDALAFVNGTLFVTGLGEGTISKIELPSFTVTTTTIGNFPTGIASAGVTGS